MLPRRLKSSIDRVAPPLRTKTAVRERWSMDLPAAAAICQSAVFCDARACSGVCLQASSAVCGENKGKNRHTSFLYCKLLPYHCSAVRCHVWLVRQTRPNEPVCYQQCCLARSTLPRVSVSVYRTAKFASARDRCSYKASLETASLAHR